MPMEQFVTEDLKAEQPSKFHQQLLEDCKALMHMSRTKMKTYHPQWDRNDDVYRSIMPKKSSSDIAARDKEEPERFVVPISYAQVQTFVAFCFSLFTQRERVFELMGFTAEDEKPAKIGEALLARDLNYNCFEAKLTQFLLDIARFNIGILKIPWVTEKQRIREFEVTEPVTAFGGTALGQGVEIEVEKEVTKFQGNRIVNISPYRFYPDIRFPITRFQEGEFCASEELYSQSQLRQWEHEGVVAGVKHIRPLGKEAWAERGFHYDTDADPGGSMEPGAGVRGDGQVKKTIIVTEIQRTIIPAEYTIGEKPLGPETYPIKYNIWLANDNRVIKCEPLGYIHDQFTYAVAPFIYDNNSLMGMSLSDTIDSLQSVITWFINSRITNVRKVISNYLVVDPKGINMSDLENRRPVLRLLSSAAGNIDRYIKQLDINDVTTNHIQDVKFLHEIVQIVTGINDALLGQFQQGRRSATEARNVTSGAAARLKMLASVIYRCALEPMARQMLSNLRDGLEEETYVHVLGIEKAQENPEFVKVTRRSLVGNYDFELFDGTLPSERHFTAQALMELVTGFISNPEAAVVLGYDVRKLLSESLIMRGIRNPERFELEPQPQMLAQPNANQTGADTTVTGGPGNPAEGLPGALPESLLRSLAGSLGGGGENGNGGGV